ncbi:MAG: hypothetical protein ACKOXO_09150 [Cyanobium sp.]
MASSLTLLAQGSPVTPESRQCAGGCQANRSDGADAPSLVLRASLDGATLAGPRQGEPGAAAGATGLPFTRTEPRQPGDPGWRVEPLQGWHLPLLDDPSFLPLQPLLQRSLLLALPDRLLTALRRRPLPACQALVALRRLRSDHHQILGLIVTRPLNRSGSSWQVEHLRLPLAAADHPADSGSGPSRREISLALLREAIQRARGATSWFATCSSLDTARLALLREQGFQPQRTDQLWRWRRPTAGSAERAEAMPEPPPLPTGLRLLRLQRNTAPLLWHLEQALCPAQLRQMLDRRIEDLLDQSDSRGWMLVDDSRHEAVAGIRWLGDHPEGGWRVALSVHPGWPQLLGSPCELLLHSLSGCPTLWISSEVGDRARLHWLARLGAEPRHDEVLMARSVWRRQGRRTAHLPVARLGAVLEQFQPRRQPLPSPWRGHQGLHGS